MKKIISLILAISMLCTISITVLAEETETVGGKITLTQFLGATLDNTKTIALSIDAKTYTINKSNFYTLADKIILTSSLDVKQSEMNGLYITAEKNDGSFEYAYITANGETDKYSLSMSRLPYAMYVADDKQTVSELFALALNAQTIQISGWATESFEKAKANGLIPESLNVKDYTQNITREQFCELAYQVMNKAGKIDLGGGFGGTPPFTDTRNEKIIRLNYFGIINSKSETEFAPNDNITRQEVATILHRMTKYMKIENGAKNDIVYADDNAISDWAKSDVYNMNALGIMKGTDTGFEPRGTYTVEQAIVTTVRLYECKY